MNGQSPPGAFPRAGRSTARNARTGIRAKKRQSNTNYQRYLLSLLVSAAWCILAAGREGKTKPAADAARIQTVADAVEYVASRSQSRQGP